MEKDIHFERPSDMYTSATRSFVSNDVHVEVTVTVNTQQLHPYMSPIVDALCTEVEVEED